MEKPEKPIESHIHCPNCLGGILEEKAVETFYTPQEIFRKFVLKCHRCDLLYKRKDFGKITRVFGNGTT